MVTTVSPAKATEPIVVAFGMWTRVIPMNHVGPDRHTWSGNSEDEKWSA